MDLVVDKLRAAVANLTYPLGRLLAPDAATYEHTVVRAAAAPVGSLRPRDGRQRTSYDGGLVQCTVEVEPGHEGLLVSLSTKQMDLEGTRIRLFATDLEHEAPITGTADLPDLEFLPCGSEELLAQVRIRRDHLVSLKHTAREPLMRFEVLE